MERVKFKSHNKDLPKCIKDTRGLKRITVNASRAQTADRLSASKAEVLQDCETASGTFSSISIFMHKNWFWMTQPNTHELQLQPQAWC